jgi:hypothetical protein
MSTKLCSSDYNLLVELAAGPRTISEARSRDGADRLVAAHYATSRNLSVSSAEYEITDLGTIALVLSQYGVLSTRYTVDQRRHDVDGLWYLIVTGEGNPALLMSIDRAQGLMEHLRAIGADALARDFACEIAKARRYAGITVGREAAQRISDPH